MLVSIVWALLIIGFLIFTHELGHFVAAKQSGIKVYEFALGFGPKLLSFKKNETVYNLRVLPFGGFVKMAGMEPDDEYYDKPEGFNTKSKLKRAWVLLAGSLTHLVLAVVLFIVLGGIIGIPSDIVKNGTIGEVMPNTPAAAAGLEPGDRVQTINGEIISDWNGLAEYIHAHPGQKLNFEIIRGKDTKLSMTIVPQKSKDGQGIIGISPALVVKRLGVVAAVKFGFEQTYRVTGLMFASLGQLFVSHEAREGLMGPVGVAQMIGSAANSGLFYITQLTALLSLNFAILNLLPLPALDGGRLLMLLVEAIRRKPVSPEKEGMFHFVGFILIILLTILVTYKDILRIGG